MLCVSVCKDGSKPNREIRQEITPALNQVQEKILLSNRDEIRERKK